MTFAGILFIIKRTGYFFADNWRAVLLAVAAFILVFGVVFVFRACNKPPKLNEKEIQESIRAVEEKNDAKLREILVTSDVRGKQIDANVANAKAATVNATAESRAKYSNMNTADLAAEIERRKSQ